MKKYTYVKLVIAISAIGAIFSGYLAYKELELDSCRIGGCTEILGVPVCIYGLFMYLLIFIISVFALAPRSSAR